MNKFTTVHMYCPPEIKAKALRLAKANRRSLSAEVQHLIAQAYAQKYGIGMAVNATEKPSLI